MNHIESLTRYTANFVDELVKSGLTDVVISPGSRSTPLAMTFCEHEGINEWVIVDERSAAFFALGMAKQSKRAVALLCTSGTAAANYFPAIIEAYYGRVPLIILTADRPHELRDVGASQSIDQIKLYGEHVKWFHEMALPESSSKVLNYARAKAARAVHFSEASNPGPVHLNFPFREPLVPDFTLENIWVDAEEASYNPVFNGVKQLVDEQLASILASIKDKPNGVIVCGPQVDEALAESIVALANALKVPILADPLSQLRSGTHDLGPIIEGYDAILHNKGIREKLKPDFIIRFGAMPVSKRYLFYIEEHPLTLQFVIEAHEGSRDPVNHSTTFLYADPVTFCKDLTEALSANEYDTNWLATWQQMNSTAKDHLLAGSEKEITEGGAVRSLLEVIPEDSYIYIGNSMAIRDLDTFFMATNKRISILANRGTSGIDGVVSSALGAAAVPGSRVTLVIGDVSFYHDLNGLLTAKHYALDITILLINNNGGGIFSFLPQAKEEKYFEVLFGTPLNIEFAKVVSMYGGDYGIATDEADLKAKITASYAVPGLSVIEVQTDRTVNKLWHEKKWQEVGEALNEL